MTLDSFLKLLEAATPIIAAIAWPVTTLILFLLLRQHLLGLIQRLIRFKHGNLEAEFLAGLERASAIAPPEIVQFSAPSEVTPQIDDSDRMVELFQLAKVSGRGAVMDAWRELELAAVGAGLKTERSVRGPLGRVSGIAAVEAMRRDGDISEPVLQLYRELRALRNRAIHANFELEEKEARKYVLFSLQLAAYFRRIGRQ